MASSASRIAIGARFGKGGQDFFVCGKLALKQAAFALVPQSLFVGDDKK
ncbi:MAG: hypothetical protein MJE77_33235 [Proteobacteria bacterium]|nr:hypothetical protein [Pseudomonadota bacterium]